MKNQIQLVLKDKIRDVQGEKVQQSAKAFLNIDTGSVKTGKIFNVMYDLSQEDIEKFANLGLKDEIIHDVYINSFYQDDRYNTFVLVAKMPGVTDDEGVSAQKTLNDILDVFIIDGIFKDTKYLQDTLHNYRNLLVDSDYESNSKVISKKYENDHDSGFLYKKTVYVKY